MNLFGKKKKAAPPKLPAAIHRLREAMDVLDKREQHLAKQMASAHSEAVKRSKAKDKRGAMYHLKRKKMLEQKMLQINGKKLNLETQVLALEDAASNKNVLGAMKMANTTLQSTINADDIDKAEDIIDETQETMQMADELGEALARPMGHDLADEDELEAELAELEAEMMNEEMMDAPVVPKVGVAQANVLPDMPSVPVKQQEAEVADDAEAREFAEIEAMME